MHLQPLQTVAIPLFFIQKMSFATGVHRRNSFCDNWYDPSLNCRKRQLRPQHQRLLGNIHKCTFATLQTITIIYF